MTATSHADALLAALRSNIDVLGELAVRYQVETRPDRDPDAPAVNSPEEVYRLLGPEMATLAQEQLRVLLLDRRNRVVEQRVIYLGNCYSAVVRLAEVLRPAVVAAVPNLIVVHNHPSGDATPSTNDVDITKALAEAATLLGIELLDHIVIGDEAVSLRERGLFGD